MQLKNLSAIALSALLGFSTISAEELFVIEGKDLDANAFATSEGIRVYAILKSGVLVGAPSEAIESLQPGANGVLRVQPLGERMMNCDYFVFQIRKTDREKLEPAIEVIYSNGLEAIARVGEGMEFDPQTRRFLQQLTRISFVPKKPIEQRIPMAPWYPLLDPDIQEIVDQVSRPQYTAYIQSLQNFVTRYSDTNGCRNAEQWAEDTFASFGLETELWAYNYSGDTWYNPIGRKIGTLYPDSIIMIVGHIDDTSENPYVSAPGAEDNGSGSSCVLEAARILSQYDFDCTIEFTLFSGEEQGLIGSEAYASYCLSQGRRIGAVLNFDMISYAGTYGWDTNIYADRFFPAEAATADLIANLTDLYSDAYSVRVDSDGPEYGSDHYYFSLYGYPAPFSIDAQLWSAPDFYPWYHSTQDVISHLDLDFGTEVVRGAVAALATLANLSIPPVLLFEYPDGLPELIAPSGGTTFRVEVLPGTSNPEPGTGRLYYNAGGGYSYVPMQVVAPNVYDAVFPALECGVDVSFFVSAEATDGSVVTDPPAAPQQHYSGFSAVDLVVLFEDDFETDLGWSVMDGGGLTSGSWERGIPAGGGDRGDPPTDFDGSGRCYVTDNRPGDSDVDGGYTYLISPPFELSGVEAEIHYALWYTNNFGGDPYNDLFKVWVSNNDGGSWTHVETIGPVSAAGWTERSFLVSDYVTPTNQVKVRFEASDLNAGSVVEAGIDAVKVVKIECNLPNLSVDIVPDDAPIVVPPGGSFTFTGTLANNSSFEAYADAWIMVDVPGYGRFGPVFQVNDLRLGGGRVVSRPGLVQNVPIQAPPGLYHYVALCGFYPASPVDSSAFDFTVTSGAGESSDRPDLTEWLSGSDWIEE